MSASVFFIDESCLREAVAAVLAKATARMHALIPGAIVEHVGATAVPGSLTRPDVDIQVRVPQGRHAEADALLALHFGRDMRTRGSTTFSSFLDASASPVLGIQLTSIGGPEDLHHRMRDFLVAHPSANAAFNDLKRRHEGGDIDEYTRDKSQFLDALQEVVIETGFGL